MKVLLLSLLLLGCTTSHTLTLPSGEQVTEECIRWIIPYYAVVVVGVVTFQTSCHIIDSKEGSL